jgi:hypothetical protein
VLFPFYLKIDRCIHFRDGYLVWGENIRKERKRGRGGLEDGKKRGKRTKEEERKRKKRRKQKKEEKSIV